MTKKKTKVIIPVAGMGSKLRPHTFTQPKSLIPIAGKPIIAYIIDSLLETEADEFIIVIGHLGHKVEQFVRLHYPDLPVTFVEQKERLGLGHAIWTAVPAFEDADEVIISLGDTILEMDFGELMRSDESVIGVSTVTTPGHFGIVKLDESGYIADVVEKPAVPTSNLAIVGIYKLTDVPALIRALNKLTGKPIDPQSEYHLADALMMMIREGIRIRPVSVTHWYDCGKRDVILGTNATLLAKLYSTNKVEFLEETNTIIIHPVALGTGCEIENSIVGPNVTVGDHSKVVKSILDNSIVGNFADLREIVLRNSIIGSDAVVKGQHLSLNIGENTEIEFR